MRISAFAFLIVTALTACTATGQVQVRGTVLDARTGEGLPAATVQVQGTYQGTVTNPQGRFVMMLSRIPATLLVRHIGYRTAQISIDEIQNADLSIQLEPVAFVMDELVVSGEDPAVPIMRRVLEEKRKWRTDYSASYSEVYTRFWLFREFDPIQVRESVRSGYWRQGDGTRELVRARRLRPAGTGTFRFAGPEYAPNFYDDEIALQGGRYATPTHADALQIYRFRLGGQRMIDSTIVFDIYFSPEGSTRPSFTGHIAVMDSVYSILEIEARPQPATAVTPPVEIHDVRYAQRFVRLDGGIVVPLDLTSNGYVSFGRLGASYPPARYEQISSISNYAINVPTPDSMFEGSSTQRVHPLVDRSDYLFVRNPTIIPLSPRETQSMAQLDPRMTVDRAFRPEGLLRAYTAIDVSENSADEEDGIGPITYLMQNSWLWYNRVDGFHPGLGLWYEFGNGIRAETKLGYSIEQKKPSFEVGLNVPWQTTAFTGSVFVNGSMHTTPTTGASNYGLLIPGVMTYLGYDDYYDYYRRERAQAGGRVSWLNDAVSLKLSVNLEDHQSQKKEDDFNGAAFRNVQRRNPAISDGTLGSLQGGLEINTEKLSVMITAEHSTPSMFESEFDFTSIHGSLSWKAVTFFRRRDRPNQLRVTLTGSTFKGTLPPQRSSVLDGRTGFYALPGSFRTSAERPLTGSKLTGIFWEHDFTTALMERLGLWGMAERGSGLVLYGAHGKVWESTSIEFPSDWYHEVGVGLTYPFRLPLRIDVAARLDARAFSFTLGRVLL